jgi:hypothetical protein
VGGKETLSNKNITTLAEMLSKLQFFCPFIVLPPYPLLKIYDGCDWACSPMVGRSSGTLCNRVQILVLAPFPAFFRIYWRYALSSKEAPLVASESPDLPVLCPSEVFTG